MENISSEEQAELLRRKGGESGSPQTSKQPSWKSIVPILCGARGQEKASVWQAGLHGSRANTAEPVLIMWTGWRCEGSLSVVRDISQLAWLLEIWPFHRISFLPWPWWPVAWLIRKSPVRFKLSLSSLPRPTKTHLNPWTVHQLMCVPQTLYGEALTLNVIVFRNDSF